MKPSPQFFLQNNEIGREKHPGTTKTMDKLRENVLAMLEARRFRDIYKNIEFFPLKTIAGKRLSS